MGLIKAGLGALGGVLADQWKEFFYCEAMDKDTLVMKGQKRISSRSSNTKGNDNIISNGSGIAVADGQCMIIVEQGKIVEVCAEPGEFTWNSSTEPSIFCGNLSEGIKETFKLVGKRFTYGGDTGKDQRIYYFNTKEIMDNKFGTSNPFMFRVVNNKLNMDRTVSVRCNGVYSYKITDPLLFYKEVCGNVVESFERQEIDNQLKTEFISGLQPAFAKLSELELRPSQIPGHQQELEAAMREVLASQWTDRRGITVASIALNPITLTDEDLKKIQQMEDAAAYGSSPSMMAGRLGDASAEAMIGAANNPNGAVGGFVGFGMAGNVAAGTGIQGLYEQGARQQAATQGGWQCTCGAMVSGNFCPNCGAKKPEPKAAEDGWTCKCGAKATGKFCPECGSAKPADEGWTCTCGAVNKGKFCPNCGAKKPADAPLYQCDKCGWKPDDPKNPPKFCPECGDVFDEKDAK